MVKQPETDGATETATAMDMETPTVTGAVKENNLMSEKEIQGLAAESGEGHGEGNGYGDRYGYGEGSGWGGGVGYGYGLSEGSGFGYGIAEGEG